MKKLIALALILASVFALCACGEAAPAAAPATAVAEPVVTEKIVEVEKEVPVIPEEYVPFKDLLDALVAEDYDSAQTILDELKPEPEKPDVVEITITKDNFFDYFEYTSDFKPDRYIQQNSKGKVVGFMFQPAYVLKDGYKVAIDEEYESNVEVGVKYKFKFYYPVKKNVDIDFEKLTYKVTGKANSTENIDELIKGYYRFVEEENANTFYIPFKSQIYMTYQKNAGAQNIPKKEIQFISANGTLYLYADSIPESVPETTPET